MEELNIKDTNVKEEEKPVVSPKKKSKIKVSIFKITNSHVFCTDKSGNGYKIKRDNRRKLDIGDTLEIEK